MRDLKEDGVVIAPTNNVGDGKVAGTGQGPQGEPGVKKAKRKVMPLMAFVRRNSPVTK
jgi:hypothetical protein